MVASLRNFRVYLKIEVEFCEYLNLEYDENL